MCWRAFISSPRSLVWTWQIRVNNGIFLVRYVLTGYPFWAVNDQVFQRLQKLPMIPHIYQVKSWQIVANSWYALFGGRLAREFVRVSCLGSSSTSSSISSSLSYSSSLSPSSPRPHARLPVLVFLLSPSSCLCFSGLPAPHLCALPPTLPSLLYMLSRSPFQFHKNPRSIFSSGACKVVGVCLTAGRGMLSHGRGHLSPCLFLTSLSPLAGFNLFGRLAIPNALIESNLE